MKKLSFIFLIAFAATSCQKLAQEIATTEGSAVLR
jgi:hypothetical protein